MKPTVSKSPLFIRSSNSQLKLEESILVSLALDMRLLVLNGRGRPVKRFVEEAQSAWETVFDEFGCSSCGPRPPILWLLDLLDESRRMKFWIPTAFVARMWHLQTRRLIWHCKCGKPIKQRLYVDLPDDFKECAEYLKWDYHIIRTWDGRYVQLSKPDRSNVFDEDCEVTKFVKAAVRAWRYVTGDEYEGSEYPSDYACTIIEKINESDCGVVLSQDRYQDW
jgi:hypothetical protein